MSYRTVEPSRGVQWLVEATQLVMRNPGVFLVQALILSVINLVPVLGQLAMLVLGPALLAGMVYSFRREDTGNRAEIGDLFAGFSQPNKMGPLIALCIPAIAGMVVLLVLGFLFIGGSLLGVIATGGDETAAALGIGGGLLAFMLLAFIVGLAIYAVIVFAVPRVMFDDVEPFAAMKESLAVSLANFLPLLIFSVLFFVAFVVVFAVLSIIPILGSIVAMLAAYAVTSAAIYVAYKDVFQPATYDSDVIIPPPPAPPAAPPAPPEF